MGRDRGRRPYHTQVGLTLMYTSDEHSQYLFGSSRSISRQLCASQPVSVMRCVKLNRTLAFGTCERARAGVRALTSPHHSSSRETSLLSLSEVASFLAMSPSDSPVADDENTDPSLEASDDANAEEEFEEVEEEEEEEEEEVEEVEEEVEEEEEEEVEEEEEEEEEVEEVEEEEEEEEEEEVEEVEEEEEEEEEVEEEEEEEEEVEEEEVEDEKETVTDSAPHADKDHRDSSQHMESEGQQGNLRSVFSVAENPAVMPSSSVHSKEEDRDMLKASVPSCEILSLKQEEIHPKHEISSHPESRKNLTSATAAEDGKSQVLDVAVENAGTLVQSKTDQATLKASVPSCEILSLKKEEIHPKHEILSHPESTKNLTSATSAEDGKSQVLDVDVENAGTLVQSKTFGGCSEPSCNSKASLGGVKDMDSGATKSSSDTGKDVATALTQRDCIVDRADGSQNSLKKIMPLEVESKDEVKQMTSRTRSVSPNAEMKGGNKRQKIICDFYAKGWCIRGSSCSFLHIKDSSNNTGQKAEGDLVNAKQKRELESEEGIKDNVESSRMNEQEIPSWHPSQEKHKFRLRDSLFPESRFAVNASSNYFSSNISSYSNRANGMATMRSQHMYNGYTSAALLSDKDFHAPRSSFSGSEREDLPLVGSSRVPTHSSGYISKIYSYDWEPSIPFRPSFLITSMSVSSPGDLYDPLRDSIEIPNIGDGSMKASLLIQGSSIQGSSLVQKYGNSAAVGKHLSDFNDDKSSVSSHNRYYENEPNKGLVPHEKDCLATEMEITSGTCINYPNGKMSMGQHTFGVKDFTKADRERTEHDARHHSEGSGHKKRANRDKKINDMDADSQADGSLQKETKALRNFRAALVDLVKELLKPSWHDGRLSKDAHIMIVKKSVDKVLSTLEPHQIPTTIDTAKQYVSSCRAKIAKLVNGYVNKYGKS